jgi:thiamine-monophosphate kinase
MRYNRAMEKSLVTWLQATFPGAQGLVANGDDAAVVKTSPLTAVTVDTQIEDVHFRWAWGKPQELGARLVGIALSDLAAMGAKPSYGVLSLTIPKGFSPLRVRTYVQGLAARAKAEGFAIVGGDVANGAAFGAMLTALGEAPAQPLRRTARRGDWLCVSGPVGQAGVELKALLAGTQKRAPRWLTPPSRLKLGHLLAVTPGVRGAMDISDGLFLDARRMAENAGLGLHIDGAAIPVEPAVRKALAGLSAREFLAALGGGEDYELLVATAPNAQVPGVVPIGRFVVTGFTVEVDGKKLPWPKVGHLHG